MTPRPGTSRFERLASFLETVMEDPKASRRVRLSAAQRLDDLLARQERKDASEARRQGREALRATRAEQQALQGETETPSPEEVATREAEQRTQRGLKLVQEILGKSS